MSDLFEKREAIFSKCRLYRYVLYISWDQSIPSLVWIMLNPSTADEYANDPTVTRVCGFARRNGYGGVCILNLNAYRATDPRAMMSAADPVGPRNDHWIEHIVHVKPRPDVVCAWGTKGVFGARDQEVLTLLDAFHIRPRILRLTKDGHPEHPLYIPSKTPLTHWDRTGAAA